MHRIGRHGLQFLPQRDKRLVLTGSSRRDEPDTNLSSRLQPDNDVELLGRGLCCEKVGADFFELFAVSDQSFRIDTTSAQWLIGLIKHGRIPVKALYCRESASDTRNKKRFGSGDMASTHETEQDLDQIFPPS